MAEDMFGILIGSLCGVIAYFCLALAIKAVLANNIIKAIPFFILNFFVLGLPLLIIAVISSEDLLPAGIGLAAALLGLAIINFIWTKINLERKKRKKSRLIK